MCVTDFAFREKVDCVVPTSQAVNFSAFFVTEMILVPGYDVFPDIRWTCPLMITDGALARHLVLVSCMSPKFLGPSIFLTATTVTTGPLPGTSFNVLGILCIFYLRNLLRSWKLYSFDDTARIAEGRGITELDIVLLRERQGGVLYLGIIPGES
jgi:hypothetical protein